MAKRVLTRSEEYSIAVHYVCGVPLADIAGIFSVSRACIYRVVDRLGVKADRRGDVRDRA